MSTRNEIKEQLRENTKKAFRLIGEKAAPNIGYTAAALANMTEGRLSAKSIEMFFRQNTKWRNADLIKDVASYNPSANYCDIVVKRRSEIQRVHKTYVSVDDPNDTFEFDKVVTLYYITRVSIDR